MCQLRGRLKSPESPDKPAVAIDCDEVLFPLAAGLIEFARGVHHKEPQLPRMSIYNFHTLYGDDDERFVQEFIRSEPDLTVPGSQEALQNLSQEFDIHVMTARDSGLVVPTVKFLLSRYPNCIKGLHFEDESTSRVDILKKIKPVASVDDNGNNVADAVRLGIRVPVLYGKYDWNSSEVPHGATRCVDWPAVENLIPRMVSLAYESP